MLHFLLPLCPSTLYRLNQQHHRTPHFICHSGQTHHIFRRHRLLPLKTLLSCPYFKMVFYDSKVKLRVKTYSGFCPSTFVTSSIDLDLCGIPCVSPYPSEMTTQSFSPLSTTKAVKGFRFIGNKLNMKPAFHITIFDLCLQCGNSICFQRFILVLAVLIP